MNGEKHTKKAHNFRWNIRYIRRHNLRVRILKAKHQLSNLRKGRNQKDFVQQWQSKGLVQVEPAQGTVLVPSQQAQAVSSTIRSPNPTENINDAPTMVNTQATTSKAAPQVNNVKDVVVTSANTIPLVLAIPIDATHAHRGTE
ncbi:hypothetical protein K7X08_028645 [Anisodus acutangulus]|uniref:Uncharacterized protein n=1 Tax=Anisodus acutangulus TaxID=402998 RepID=A0A9Q1LVW3_9SOLA|nr:hypothetical protein K7X08_028645 [Anisodus acutangulus]